MARTREVAGGGRAVEVEPERLVGWFDRFAARHGGFAAARGTALHVWLQTADGASAEVAVPFGGLPPGAVFAADLIEPVTGETSGARAAAEAAGPTAGPTWCAVGEPTTGRPAAPAPPAALISALHTHLTVPRRIGIVLVRLGGYSVGVAVGGTVQTSTTGARPVHGRNRKGGSSSGRFARRRENQARVALDAAADAAARILLPVAPSLDAVVLGGDAAALDDLRADRRLAALLARAEPRVLDVPEPRRAGLDEAARRAVAVEIVVREPGA